MALTSTPPIDVWDIQKEFNASSLRGASNNSGISANALSFLGKSNYNGPSLVNTIGFGKTQQYYEWEGTWYLEEVGFRELSYSGSGCMPGTQWYIRTGPYYNTSHLYPWNWNGDVGVGGTVPWSGSFSWYNYDTESLWGDGFWWPAARGNYITLYAYGTDNVLYSVRGNFINWGYNYNVTYTERLN